MPPVDDWSPTRFSDRAFKKGRRRCLYQWRAGPDAKSASISIARRTSTRPSILMGVELFVIWIWGKSILDQLVDFAGYGIGPLLVEGAKGNPGGLG